MDMTEEYANAAFIPGGTEYPDRWAAKAAAFRALNPPLTVAYGSGPREVFHMFLPVKAPLGLLVFVHGGYWKAFDKDLWSQLAAGALARGWAVAIPSYDLCPQVRISDITRQVRDAITGAAGLVPGPIILTGHSAGGHLVARAVCADLALPDIKRVRQVVAISPLSNLAPLMATAMNATLGIDAPEAAAESPVLHPRPAVPVTVWVGGAERPAFLDQARWLSRAWDAPLVVDAGRHHFDVIEGLEQADSPLIRCLLRH